MVVPIHPPKPRIDALDQTKGVLVVLMVIYHALNYTSQYYLAFRYFAFLPPSFIFITGYLISSVYFKRYDGINGLIQKRLLIRGGKLLLLFTALNIVAHLFLRRGRTGERLDVLSFFNHWQDVYVTGSGRFAVFEVLLPISYLLILAPWLIWAGYRHRFLLPVITVMLLGICTFLEYRGYSFANLNLLSAGAFGMIVGQVSTEKLDALGRHVLITLLAYAAYIYIGLIIGQTYLVQLLGAAVALALIFSLCTRLSPRGWPRTQLIRLGQYSLVSYIVQIGFLQVLSRFVYRPAPISIGSAFLFTATLILTMACVVLIEWARSRSSRIEKFYKAVFA